MRQWLAIPRIVDDMATSRKPPKRVSATKDAGGGDPFEVQTAACIHLLKQAIPLWRLRLKHINKTIGRSSDYRFSDSTIEAAKDYVQWVNGTRNVGPNIEGMDLFLAATVLLSEFDQVRKDLISAQCVVRQVARDTFGKDMTVKEFAEQSSYDH
jgi:hypothetical protein